MPNARVGAMPHTPALKEQQHGGNNKVKSKERRRQKGITMEDLKQQTAMRLAKEQRRRNAVTASRNARTKILSQDLRKQGVPNPGSLEIPGSCDNSISSSSLHSHHVPPISQNSVDDFPHGNFDFGRKDPVSVSGTPIKKHQEMQMQLSPKIQNHQAYIKQQHSQKIYQNLQNNTPQKSQSNYYHGHSSKYSNQNQHQSSNKDSQDGAQSNSSKLPHGLTVQELKEMTRARLAAEASEGDEAIKPTDSLENELRSHLRPNEQPRHPIGGGGYPQDPHMMNRQRILSSESFCSSERQRLGSAESFGSVRSGFTNSGYQHRNLLTSSLSNDLPEQSVSSFSYDAQDNESLTSALGSESFFGSETIASKAATKYSTNSTLPKNPFSSNKSSPSSHGTKVTTNTRNDGWNDPLFRTSSPSSIPTIAHSSSSFGASDNENSSFFGSMPVIGKLERMVSAGAVVPNSVAESVLEPSGGTNGLADDVFNDYKTSMNLVSPKTEKPSSHYTFPWSNSKKEGTNERGEDLTVSRLNTEWNSLLHVDGKDSPDDFPLSTFTSNGAAKHHDEPDTSPENHYYSAPFQPVPEERVIQNLVSRDVNLPESFIDDNPSVLFVPKLRSKMKRDESRNLF